MPMSTRAAAHPPITTLCVGHATHDRSPKGTLIGGSAIYGAHVMRALGARSRVVTVLGHDFECMPDLRNLEVACGRCPHTTVFENVYNDAARSQRVHALAVPIGPELMPRVWAKCDAVFFAPVCGEVPIEGWLDSVEARWIAVGLQGFVRNVDQAQVTSELRGTPVRHEPWRPSPEVLQRLALVVASEEDLRAFDSAPLMRSLRDNVPLVIVTNGKNGATVHTDSRTLQVSAHPAHQSDPTGAGDTFAAAMLFALANGESIPEAARLASACASIIVESQGISGVAHMSAAKARAANVSVTERS